MHPKQSQMSCPFDPHLIHPSMLNRSSGKSAPSGRILQIEFANFSLVRPQGVPYWTLGSPTSTC